MTDGHCFISYSAADGLDFATKLADELQGRHPNIKVWFDKREMDASIVDWDDQLANAIKGCKCLVFVMTPDSTAKGSTCKEEWTWALKYKKPVICLLKEKKAEVPFRLNNRQYIDISTDFDAGIAQLRSAIKRLDEPEGILEELDRRLSQAKRDFQRTPREEEKPRIQAEIEELNKQIEVQQKIVTNPKKAEEQTQKNIEAGLERERQPEKPVAGKTSTRFINPPPGIAPNYFQDRLIETKQITDFLNNDSQRLMTIVGRAGVGKTAMVCRLLKALERGELPDDLGEMKVDGIVYLSETGSHRVNFANVFADLSKLLPAAGETAERLEGIYKNPQTSTGDKMRALLDAFPSGRVILLLDNFETLIDPESLSLRDSELSEALNALLGGQHHAVKAVITTRIAPRDLAVSEPGRQHTLSLDEGLESPYAENILREMDADGRVGLKSAPDALLNKAREKTRGYPRALEALYAILSVDRYTTLEELLELSLPDEVVQTLVGEAFNRLDPSAQKVMQALAVYNRPVSPAAIDYLLQPHLPSIDSALVLNRLVYMRFVRKDAGIYSPHSADKEYALSIIPSEKALTMESTETTENQQEDSSQLTTFTQHNLLNRAADYYLQARKPRAEWKNLNDVSAQLAEFELRCEAGDYDTAANILSQIGFNYLYRWGHYRVMIDLRLRLLDKIVDKNLQMDNLNELGECHRKIGRVKESISFLEQGLDSSREIADRYREGSFLNYLGHNYSDLGDTHKAIEFYEQALVISRESGYRGNEGVVLGNIADQRIRLGEFELAIQSAEQYVKICEEINKPASYAFRRLAEAYLYKSELTKARESADNAKKYDEPQNNHNISMLTGIIALRQGERKTAQEAFTKSIAQADEILSKTAEYYSALDAKGLALCGLVLCRGAVPAPNDAPTNNTGRGDPAPTINDAIETFRKARKIAPHAGVVKSVLRLFDELVKCDETGILKDVRKAVEGV